MDTKFSVVVLIISFCVFLTSHKLPPIVLKFFFLGGGGGVSGRGGMTWFSKLPENLDFMHLDPGPRPKKHK